MPDIITQYEWVISTLWDPVRTIKNKVFENWIFNPWEFSADIAYATINKTIITEWKKTYEEALEIIKQSVTNINEKELFIPLNVLYGEINWKTFSEILYAIETPKWEKLKIKYE